MCKVSYVPNMLAIAAADQDLCALPYGWLLFFHAQGEMMNQIEHNVNSATAYVSRGEEGVSTAIVYKRQSRRVSLDAHVHTNPILTTNGDFQLYVNFIYNLDSKMCYLDSKMCSAFCGLQLLNKLAGPFLAQFYDYLYLVVCVLISSPNHYWPFSWNCIHAQLLLFLCIFSSL